MNDETKLGFQLYTQHNSAHTDGVRLCRMVDADSSVCAWYALPSGEKLMWQKRAAEVAACSAPPSPTKTKKRNKRISRKTAERRVDFRPMQLIDEDSEDDMGILTGVLVEESNESALKNKYEHDRCVVEEAIKAQTGGNVEKIRLLRFLFASAQTFGNVDDACMLAEFSMNEFNLRDGVVDRFATVVGPWKVENEIRRQRAIFHANETHHLPLNVSSGIISKRDLLAEILGRSEPAIAAEQGIKVGLYREEVEDSEERLNRLFVSNRNINHIVDGNNRRWIICLRQEYHNILASLRYLRDTVGLDYDGFPCTPDRFILADAFVDSVAACLDGFPRSDTNKLLKTLGSPMPGEFTTPWERNGELFCTRHRLDRNSCCAAVTASRATFIILYALEDLLKKQ